MWLLIPTTPAGRVVDVTPTCDFFGQVIEEFWAQGDEEMRLNIEAGDST